MTQREKKQQIRPKLNLPSQRKDTHRTNKVAKRQSIDDLFKQVEKETKHEETGLDDTTTENITQEVEISTDEWKKTFRKTDTIELANLIKNTTITHNSLLRLTGSYSTKMLANLKLNNQIMSGIENKPSKVFYNRNTDIKQAINNHTLSYIPYFFNYYTWYNEEKEEKLYVDNLTIVNNNLFFSLFLNKVEHVEVECINITREDIITGNINNLDKEDFLKVVITDITNGKQVIELLNENKKSNLVFMELDKTNKMLHVSILRDGILITFSYKELLAICKEKKTKYHDKQLYTDVRNKYEFERRVIN